MTAKRGREGEIPRNSEKRKNNLTLIMDVYSCPDLTYPKVKNQWPFIVQLPFCTLMLELNFSKICNYDLKVLILKMLFPI